MKKLKNISGIKILNKQEQKQIKGGLACTSDSTCPGDTICCYPIGGPEGLCGLPDSWMCS